MYPFSHSNTLDIAQNVGSQNDGRVLRKSLAAALESEGAIVTQIGDDGLLFQAGLLGSGFFPKAGSFNRVMPFDRGYLWLEPSDHRLKLRYSVRMLQAFIAASFLAIVIFLIGESVTVGVFTYPILPAVLPFALLLINRFIAIERFEAWMRGILN